MKPCLTEQPVPVQSYLDNQPFEQELYNESGSLSSILCGDLYIVGRLWIDALKTGLVGVKSALIPVVEAKAEDTPQKPPPMKYTDLPLYECPHYEYKDYLEHNEKCPDANVKLIRESLLPYVKRYRQSVKKGLCEAKCLISDNLSAINSKLRRAKADFKQTMRDPDNVAIRQGLVFFGGTAGFLLGGGGGIPRRLFFTSLGFLSAGALCFPKETDEAFRNIAFSGGKVLIAAYNKWCGKDFGLRERLACRDDLPAPPPTRQLVQCPPKK